MAHGIEAKNKECGLSTVIKKGQTVLKLKVGKESIGRNISMPMLTFWMGKANI